jgi:hypothetical protein
MPISDNKNTKIKLSMAPSKNLIHMLYKDITVEKAVLEVIDTAIEYLLYNQERGIFTDKKGNIRIQLSPDSFTMESNSGGPPKELVSSMQSFGQFIDKGAFRIGASGMGLKKAVFKIGQDIHFESDNGKEHLSLHIDKNWIASDNWGVELEVTPSTGTLFHKIIISDLYPDIKKTFEDQFFMYGLKQKVRTTYTHFIKKNIDIQINNELIEAYNFQLLSKPGRIEPYYRTFKLNGIYVKIYAGFTKWKTALYGWHVFCNNRSIIQKDTTYRTGFDSIEDINNIYPEANIFLGVVFFNSYLFKLEPRYRQSLHERLINKEIQNVFKDNGISFSNSSKVKIECLQIPKKHWRIIDEDADVIYEVEDVGKHLNVYGQPTDLPWTTTMDNVREDLRLYRKVREEMIAITGRFINYIRVAKRIGAGKNEDVLKSLFQDIDLIDISQISKEQNECLPQLEEECGYDTKTRTPMLTRVEFWVRVPDAIKIKEKLGNTSMSNKEMGEMVFSKYKKMEDIK